MAFYRKFGKSCSICKSSSVQLHHIKYGNFGHERDEDLVALCANHHAGFHSKYGVKGQMTEETHEYIYSALFEEEVERVMKNI